MTLHELKRIFSNEEKNKYQHTCHVTSRVDTQLCELIDTN